jgi:RNA polymerase sigma-70 factor (ECF subfamily)
MSLPTSLAVPAVATDTAAAPAEDVAAFTARLAAADDAAWTEAHRRYAPRLFRYLLVATRGDEQTAGDAMQAAFVRAVRHARVFHTEEAHWGWLTLLARHALADARRAAGRWRAFLARFTRPMPGPPWCEPDPLPELLDQALAGLPETERSLLERKYFAAASIRELAIDAGVSEKAIESRLTRARQRLRQSILLQLRR